MAFRRFQLNTNLARQGAIALHDQVRPLRRAFQLNQIAGLHEPLLGVYGREPCKAAMTAREIGDCASYLAAQSDDAGLAVETRHAIRPLHLKFGLRCFCRSTDASLRGITLHETTRK
jgi:hypothetical protein